MAPPNSRPLATTNLPLLWGLVMVLFAAAAGRCVGQESDSTLTAKAAVVLKAIRHTEWPESAFAAPESAIVVGVLGDGGMTDILKRTVRDQRVRGRVIEVRQLTMAKPSPEKPEVSEDELSELVRQVRASEVLFICVSEHDRVKTILQRLGSADVLTISDMEAFADRGGMIGLIDRDGQIVVDASPNKIQGTRLKVAPELLQTREADRPSTIKAGMVLNFIRYAEWPETAFGAAESPIVISMLGEGEMTEILRRTVRDQRVHGRAIEVRRLKIANPSPGAPGESEDELGELLAQARTSHVLFVCGSERERVETILRRLGDADVLTVSDIDSFAERGGMLGLAIRRQRVAVDANPEKIHRTQLKVSSQLLRLARTVKTRGQ